MKKSILYSSGAILGVISIAGVSFGSVYYVKYKNLHDGLDFTGSRVKINMYDSLTDTTPVSKIYNVEKGEINLAELMLHHTNDFKLGPESQFGRMVLSIYGVFAKFSKGSWWQLASPTYILEHPKAVSTQRGQTSVVNALNLGVSKIILKNSQVINFYKTPTGSTPVS